MSESTGRMEDFGGTAPQCMLCKHRPDDVLFACAAFPALIPLEIRENRYDHRKPWIDPETGEPGDQGIPLAGSILFEPAPDADPEVLQELYGLLERPPVPPPPRPRRR